MTALIPRLKRFLEKNPKAVLSIGVALIISAVILVLGFYLLTL